MNQLVNITSHGFGSDAELLDQILSDCTYQVQDGMQRLEVQRDQLDAARRDNRACAQYLTITKAGNTSTYERMCALQANLVESGRPAVVDVCLGGTTDAPSFCAAGDMNADVIDCERPSHPATSARTQAWPNAPVNVVPFSIAPVTDTVHVATVPACESTVLSSSFTTIGMDVYSPATGSGARCQEAGAMGPPYVSEGRVASRDTDAVTVKRLAETASPQGSATIALRSPDRVRSCLLPLFESLPGSPGVGPHRMQRCGGASSSLASETRRVNGSSNDHGAGHLPLDVGGVCCSANVAAKSTGTTVSTVVPEDDCPLWTGDDANGVPLHDCMQTPPPRIVGSREVSLPTASAEAWAERQGPSLKGMPGHSNDNSKLWLVPHER